MIKDFLFHVKYAFLLFPFNRKKHLARKLKESFGSLKSDTFNFKQIESYFRKKDHYNAHQVITDKTCNDLDFDQLFMFLDRTNSRVGQQYYYNKLRTIDVNPAQTKLNEELIQTLSKDSDLRIDTQKKLEALNNKDAYNITCLFQEEHITPPKFFFVIKLLSFISLVSLLLAFYNPLFFMVLIGVFCINFVVHYWNKNNLIPYTGSIPQLLKLNNIAANLHLNPLFQKINPNLSVSIKFINAVKSKMFFFQLEAKLQGEFEVILWFVFELFKIMFLIEPLLLFDVLKKLDTKRNEIENVYTFIGHLDMLISIASLRHGLDTYCFPDINKGLVIKANQIAHPLIQDCTTNNVEISDKSILLTGSNMSGKTSFIRTIGINVITGLTINTCFAKSMSFPLLKIFSAIRINDDLINNKSYYFEEVVTIKEMLKESHNGSQNLFLLDELFKGTNTVERIAAGKAVLSELAKNNNKILVATHDIELTDLLSNQFDLYHFSETVENEKVGFDYKLKEGKLKNRNAIKILEMNKYPSGVVHEAIEISKQLDKKYS
ncbi:MutS-related protein [Neptunitalea lumnitzerae]|uniref:DNA mismatch repair protein MutS n=1 Tax=Neptunitalea lumnitzerae TaxID=2965509 RepID=A0ABQ5MJ12_9FLAO|nr:DNA mismatch repair protein MutS [Neptunitalea sp. Y10]GLB49379.1 DNA mismatch repair protein MutS [Neptunitalea sp. Y10]